jgi:hypothetical protein
MSQDRGEGEEDEAVMSRAREGRREGIEDGADRLGELLVSAVDLASRGTGLARLPASGGTELLPELLAGQARAGPVGYTGHRSLLV